MTKQAKTMRKTTAMRKATSKASIRKTEARAKSTKTSEKKKAKLYHAEVTRIRLTNDCKKQLNKLSKEYRSKSKAEMDKDLKKKYLETARDIASSIWRIECGTWYIPTKSFEYTDIVKSLEKTLPDFFYLPKGTKIEIGTLDSPILSFDKGHPKGVK